MFLLGITLFRTPQFREKPYPLLLGFAGSNLVSGPTMFLVSYVVVGLLAGRLTGWSGAIIIWLPTLFLLMLLFVLQFRAVPKRLLRGLRWFERCSWARKDG